jgi:hypothetical protein
MREGKLAERDFWLIIYRALKMMLFAIEQCYLGAKEVEIPAAEKSHTPND